MATNADTTEEPDQGAWVHVKSKSRHHKSPRRVAVKPSTRASPPSSEPRDRESALDIANEYDKVRSRWRSSSCHDDLVDLVASNSTTCRSIRTAVCLGLGTFDPEDGGWDAKRRTYIQLDAFLTMVECLSKYSAGPIACIFQEPRFSASDKKFLQTLGHTVVETPRAFDLVDDGTLLFAVHMYRPIYEAALKQTLPAMFVGTGWDVWDEFGNLEAGGFKRMREIHDTHQKFAFPQDGSYTTFSSTSIYWKRLPEPSEAPKPSPPVVQPD